MASVSDVFVINSEVLRLFEASWDGIAVWTSNPLQIAYANRALCAIVGSTTEEVVTQVFLERLAPASRTALVESLESVSRGNCGPTGKTSPLLLAGGRGLLEVRLCRLSDPAEHERASVGMIVRRCDDAAANRRDPLTELPDREFLMQRLGELLRGARVADRRFAVVFLDLDNFKQVNDEFGHLLGDNVLREAARRIDRCVREGDHAVRFGGDEFVLLLDDVQEEADVEPVLTRIRAALAKPVDLPEGKVTLAMSVGIAFPGDHDSPEELVAAADRAMYAAKRQV